MSLHRALLSCIAEDKLNDFKGLLKSSRVAYFYCVSDTIGTMNALNYAKKLNKVEFIKAIEDYETEAKKRLSTTI